MRLTVLGKSPSWQDAGGACSGYLIEEAGTTILVDCGNGVFGKLRERMDYVDVDAVLISHLHADHFLDLVPFSYALTYAPRQQPVPVDRLAGDRRSRAPRSCTRRRATATLRRVCGRGQRGPRREGLELREYEANSRLTIGPLETASSRCPISPRPSPCASAPPMARADHLRARTPAHPGPERVRRRGRPHPRGSHPAPPGAKRQTRPPPPGRSSRACAGHRRAAATGWAHLGRARRRLGPPPGRGGLRRPGRGGGRGRHLRGLRPSL